MTSAATIEPVLQVSSQQSGETGREGCVQSRNLLSLAVAVAALGQDFVPYIANAKLKSSATLASVGFHHHRDQTVQIVQ